MKIILMHNLTEAVQASQDNDRKANAQLQSSDSFSPEPDIDPSDLLDGIITNYPDVALEIVNGYKWD